MAQYSAHNTPQGQKAAELQESLRYTLADIRQDTKLTPEGKRARIAHYYLETKKAVEKLKAEEEANRTKTIAGLRRDLFGHSGVADANKAISIRDAQERVASLGLSDEDKALELLDRATLSGDDVLTKAIVTRAVEMQWVNVANTYIDAHPYYGSKLEQLWDIERPDPATSNGLASLIQDGDTFHMFAPTEISNVYTDAALEQIAATAA